MTEYEIQVAGPIGPVARSGLPPGFTTTTASPSTTITGTVPSPHELLNVINLLSTHGVALIEIWITRDQSR